MRKLLFLILCLMLLGCGKCFAEVPVKHTFELTPEIFYFTYKEPGVMKETGMMYGLLGSYHIITARTLC
jgi:hypothetical protein